MTRHEADQVTIAVNDEVTVSGLMVAPAGARACYVMAHGAGAGMAHPFMGAMAAGLAERGIASLRYQFPYMELGGRRRMRPHLRRRPFAPRLPRRVGLPLGFHSSRAGNPSEGG